MPKKEITSPPPDYGGSLFDMQKVPCDEREESEVKCRPDTGPERCEREEAFRCETFRGDERRDCGPRPEPPVCGSPCCDSCAPERESSCSPLSFFSKISAEDLLLFGAALFLLFSKENDNIIIPVLLVLVIML